MLASIISSARHNSRHASSLISSPTLRHLQYRNNANVFNMHNNNDISHVVVLTTATNSIRFMSSSNSDNLVSPSSSEGGFFSRMRGKFTERTERKKSEQMAEQLEKMSTYEVWTLGCFAEELETSMSDWKTKIPGMGMTAQVKSMKEATKMVQAIMSQVGRDATAETFSSLGRREKLKIALKGECSLEDLNNTISQFNNMQIMHRVLRYRKSNGRPLPKDEKSMQLAIQEDAKNVMSKKEKKALMMEQRKKGARGMR